MINKFKVFDKLHSIMHKENSGFFLFTNGVLGYNSGDTYEVVDKKNFDVLFFTGLQDKNGKDIYEGDILNNEWVVFFYTGMFVAVSINKTPTHDNSYQIQWVVLTYDAIISGNIYENPELLTPQK